MSTYPGTIFPIGSTRQVVATLTITADAIMATTEDGQGHVVPLTGCTVRRGGLDQKTVVITAVDQSCSVSSQDPAFLRELERVAGAHVGLALGQDRKATARRKRGCIGCALLTVVTLIVLSVGTIFGLMWAVRASVGLVPISADIALGEQSIASMDLGGPVITTPEIQHFIQQVVDRLGKEMVPPGGKPADYAFPLKVRVVESPQINAYALPGGQIVVFTGLIKQADSADQVACVLGHEIAHVTIRHGMQGIVRSVGVLIIVSVVMGDVSGILSQVAMASVINGYSREQEREADREGARIAAAAGFDPNGIAEFFTLLKTQPNSEAPGILQVFSTHPGHDERIQAARELAKTLTRGAPANLHAEFLAARAAIGARSVSASAAVSATTAPTPTSASAATAASAR